MKLILLALLVSVAYAAPTPMDDPSGDAVEVVVNGLGEGEALDIGHIVGVKVKEIVDGEVAVASNPLHPFTAQGLAEIAEAEATAAAEAEPALPEIVLPEPALPEVVQPEIPGVVLPEPALPEVIEPQIPGIMLPEPAVPEVVQPEIPGIVLPEPALPEVVKPEIPGIVLPEPALPEVVKPEIPGIVLPEPALPEVVEPEIPGIVLPEPALPEVVVPEVTEELPNLSPATGEIFNDGTVSVTVNAPEDAGVYATLQSWVNVILSYVNSGVQMTQQIL